MKNSDGRADNQPEAARTIVLKSERVSVPRALFRPAKKTAGRRADNQPGAVRTSVWHVAENPVPRSFPLPEKIPNNDEHARAAGAAELRTACIVGVGGVNSMSAVGCVVW